MVITSKCKVFSIRTHTCIKITLIILLTAVWQYLLIVYGSFVFLTISWKDTCSLTVLIIMYLDGNTFALIDNILSSNVDS